jgi:type IX secretion system PorP/SprF family membrane protein
MKKLLLLGSIAFAGICQAQDPHFSQYYASQQTINPASVGLFAGDMRVSGLFRQQWPQYGTPFVTGTFAFEIKPKGYRDGENINRLAFGGLVVFDKTPDEVLTGNYVYGTVAYHKALDEEGHHKIGLGFMGGYNQKMLDASKLTFGSGYTGDPNNPFGGSSGENFAGNRSSSFDLHSGLMYSYETDDKMIYAGGSVYHLIGPKEFFTKGQTLLDHVPRRINASAGFNTVNGNGIRFAGSALFMTQQKVNEIMAGATVGFPFSEENGVLYTGVWYRVDEAIIPTINLQWKTMNLGFSYDAFLSSKKTLTKPKSIEFSLAYRLIPYHSQTGCFAF